MNGLFIAILAVCCIIAPALFIVLAGILLAGVFLHR